MKIQEVIDRIANIKRIRGDDERAHGAEDALHQDVLRAIAGGTKNCRRLATEALKTLDIKFARWCA